MTTTKTNNKTNSELDTITINVNGNAKTYTAITDGYDGRFNTVSLKSIYDRILTGALQRIIDGLSDYDLDATMTSDCGRFTFTSGFVASRDNTARSYENEMRSACIKYRSDVEDSSGSRSTFSNKTLLPDVSMQIAKWPISGDERTVYVTPSDDVHRCDNWNKVEASEDLDCTFEFGVVHTAYQDLSGKKGKSVTVDGTTYYEKVTTNTYTRKARLRYCHYDWVFTTMAELDAAIEEIIEIMAEQTYIDAAAEILDAEEKWFADYVAGVYEKEERVNEFNNMNTTLHTEIIKMLDDAGFEKCDRWHYEAVDADDYYSVRMHKETSMGTCVVLVQRFRTDSKYCSKTDDYIVRKVIDFGICFGTRNSGQADHTVDALDITAKVQTAIKMAEAAC